MNLRPGEAGVHTTVYGDSFDETGLPPGTTISPAPGSGLASRGEVVHSAEAMESLVQDAKSGDEKALMEVWNDFQDMLKVQIIKLKEKYCNTHNLKSVPFESDDMLQDLFVIFKQTIDNQEKSFDISMKAFLRLELYHLFNGRKKIFERTEKIKNKIRRGYDGSADIHPDQFEKVHTIDLLRIFETANLDEREREMVMLLFGAIDSDGQIPNGVMGEIAAELSVTPANARMIKTRLTRSLSKLLEKVQKNVHSLPKSQLQVSSAQVREEKGALPIVESGTSQDDLITPVVRPQGLEAVPDELQGPQDVERARITLELTPRELDALRTLMELLKKVLDV